MAIGRISGSVLKSNLTRNGTDLAFETNLLYLDVTNSRIGVGTSEPTTTLQVNGTTTTTGLTASGAIAANGSGNSITVADTLRIAQSGSGLRMTNVGAFDNDGSDNFRIFSTNDLILSSNGDSNTALTIDGTTQNVTINQDLGVTGNLTVDTNTLFVNASNNRVGIGTTSPAYQVEIENTSANALLVLDRTDGASTFIEGGATDSVIGSVGANDVKIAYNSVPVVSIGASGAITVNSNFTLPTTDGSANQFLQTDGSGNVTFQSATVSDISDLTATAAELNVLDGTTLGAANELCVVDPTGNFITTTSTLSIDQGNNYIGINQSSPEVTLHMTGEGAQTAQIRMEQYNDSADAPDVRTRRYRGTIAEPLAVNSGDYLFRSNHEYWNGTSLLIGGAFAFDNTNNANRTEYRIAVDTDGTGGDILNGWQFKIDGNDGGAITFNNAYKFPTSDGSANQYLKTDGAGNVSWSTVVASTGDITFTGSTISSPSNADITLNPGGTGQVVLNSIKSDDSSAIQINDSIDMGGNIVPRADNAYSLGSPTSQWAALYVTGSTIYLGDLALSADTGTNSLRVLKKKAGRGKQNTSIADDYESTTVETAGVGDLVITGSTISAPSNADITITNSGTGAVNVDSNKIINLGTPTADTDAATKVYVDDSVAAVSTTSIAQLNSSVAVTDSGSNGTITVSADGNTELVINDTSATFSGQVVANNALSVTGNITVTGTVDGRDVATDGTKLDGIESGATADQTDAEIKTAYENNSDTNAFTDAEQTKLSGIESGATADQTASEILTAIKTVDGTGSGLDADTLDGVQGSSYATLTGSQTLTNKIINSASNTITITESNISDLGAYITASSSDTLTNKTLTSPQVNTQIDVLAQGQVRLQDTSGGQYIALRAPGTVTSNTILTLPDGAGTSGQVLSTDGAGVLSWADGGGGGSGASYPNSTISTLPGSDGNYDLGKNAAQDTAETPFESGGTDAFGVNLGTVFDMMDPIGTTETTDLGADEAYVGA